MARLWVLSDLHGEFRPDDRELARPKNIDAVILAGDMHKAREAVDYGRALAGDLPLIMVAGNHEHYSSRLTVPEGIVFLTEAAEKDRGVGGAPTYFLENAAITLELNGESILFAGATLWTDFLLFSNYEQSERIAKESMYDFVVISGANTPYRPLHPSDTVIWHRSSRAFIRQTLTAGHSCKTVVITHHAPSMRSVAAHYLSDSLTPAFASDCDDLLGLGAELWVHGHMHDSFDYMAHKTRVVCNPRGYPVAKGHCGFENRAFDPQFVVEI
jgi:hypothetical protein